jgi:ABC-type transport system involved in cytochrome bd biosynthesis fused ATPase/permease subunit
MARQMLITRIDNLTSTLKRLAKPFTDPILARATSILSFSEIAAAITIAFIAMAIAMAKSVIDVRMTQEFKRSK